MRRIWLCADDYGISTAVNVAVRDLVVRGRLNATSALVVAPSCYRSEAISLSALNSTAPRVAIGLHVALTAPFRPSSNGFSQLREGAFMPLSATLIHALLRRFKNDALAAEVASQVKDFRRLFGRLPDFIDGHQHVHLLPQIRDAVLRVAKDAAPNAWLRQCGRAAPIMASFADRKGLFLDVLSRSFRRRAAALGLRTNPAFAGTYAFAKGADFRALFPRFLDRLPDGGVVMCHPGFVDAELARLDPLTTLREREYAFLAGDSFPALLAAHGVTLQTARQP
jgi:chitin disaccharide deacetylase